MSACPVMIIVAIAPSARMYRTPSFANLFVFNRVSSGSIRSKLVILERTSTYVGSGFTTILHSFPHPGPKGCHRTGGSPFRESEGERWQMTTCKTVVHPVVQRNAGQPRPVF